MKKLILFLALIAVLSGCIKNNPDEYVYSQPEEFHVHADFKVYLLGELIDFNKSEFMSDEQEQNSLVVHMHGFNPNVIHFHAKGVKLGEFFSSLGMSFTENCFEVNGKNYCSDEVNSLKLFVNRKENSDLNDYVAEDLDKILIFYGKGNPSQKMLDSVSSEACIYSEKCEIPDGIILPNENCYAGDVCYN